jgi:hypothetical protein
LLLSDVIVAVAAAAEVSAAYVADVDNVAVNVVVAVVVLVSANVVCVNIVVLVVSVLFL